ncbi:TetR/AcrR family transcriptional regulator [Methanocella sp. MCL-LM]|uniref:TetR/AcrR family transcriptional regulator n=1 Tax=Methanocella sp. MCL-LM TaxID=3412035 RepID=UPI003C796D24
MAEAPYSMIVETRVRNKADKISRILSASKQLIETAGYENVTIRDIAGEAGVSVGLIYKYFPGGKPEIIREIGMSLVTEMTGAGKPGSVDFDDFPGFLRGFFGRTVEYYRENRRFIAALMVATLQDRSIFEGFEEIGLENLDAFVRFLGGFKGVDLSDKGDPRLFMAKWSDVVKSIMLHHAIYPTPFDSDEEIVELLVKISLMMWGYKK